jgi:stage III sporulation protein AB
VRLVLKACGFTLVLLAGYLAGEMLAGRFARRHDELRRCQVALEVLATEIDYAATPLGPALERAGRAAGGRTGAVFERTGRLMTDGDGGASAAGTWESGLANLREVTPLAGADLEILRTLGRTLGTTDRADQRRHLVLAAERLRIQENQAREARSRNEGMWRYLGVLGGLAVGLTLI